MNKKREVHVFSLPAEENHLNILINDENVQVMNKVITPCPKEGIILYLVEIERIIEKEDSLI